MNNTNNFLNVGTTLYNVDNGKTWIVFYSEYNTTINDWEFLLVLADSKEFLVLGKDKKVTGTYVFNRINENKIIINKK